METIPKVTYRSKSVEITHIHTKIFKYKIKSNSYVKCMLKKLLCSFPRNNCAENTQNLSHFSPKVLKAKLKRNFM